MGATTKFLMLLTTTTTTLPSPLLHHRCSTLIRLTRHRRYHHHNRQRLSPSLPLHRRHHHSLSTPPLLAPAIAIATTTTSPLFPTKSSRQLHAQSSSAHFANFSSPSTPRASQPWPEWSYLLCNLSASGYFDRQGFGAPVGGDGDFVAVADLPEEFLRAASACLAFARDRGNLFRMLSRRDIEVVVQNGTPFLFKNSDDSLRRMRSFLGSGENNVLDSDKENMVDLMRFLLSYASNLAAPSETNNMHNMELVESSVRNLFSELAKLSYGAPEVNPSGIMQKQFPDRYGQTPRTYGQNIEMKRGDWICLRCSFMNFARNVKCLECEEARPKRQLTGGEWECPQCDFYNYGRNIVCLRCDCKRPGEVSLGTTNSRSAWGYVNENSKSASKVDLDSRLAANEEKAQRWFSKVSQLDSTSDMSSAIADEDFPEIMPLRKGVNRFVVSTRKTPLERRLANAQYQRNLGNDGTPEGNDLQIGGTKKSLDMRISQSLDEILGPSSATSESNNNSVSAGKNTGADSPPTTSISGSPQYGHQRESNANYVPFVPLAADTFAKKSENSKMEESETTVMDNYKSVASNPSERTGAVSGSNEYGNSWDSLKLSKEPVSQTEGNDKEKEQAEKTERWFKRVSELHGVNDLSSAISDEDFPEIMPMRKGENRFVISKKKDRSLTSPMNKRRMAMEQASNTNYVPFVPFPPNYFAKKDDEQVDGVDSSNKPTGETSNCATQEKFPEKLEDARSGVLGRDHVEHMENQQINAGSWNSNPSGERLDEIKSDAAYGTPVSGNSTRNFINPQTSGSDGWSDRYSGKETTSSTGISAQPSQNQNIRNSWTGKSLEGSAVKEPDPLDMSEEAKAERWFRRVAQIKDISELSQIPDEDFPSIMPMRKGVNRFVVSKRKTPLERRLTSQQYRRNLPVVSSDPLKKDNDSS